MAGFDVCVGMGFRSQKHAAMEAKMKSRMEAAQAEKDARRAAALAKSAAREARVAAKKQELVRTRSRPS